MTKRLLPAVQFMQAQRVRLAKRLVEILKSDTTLLEIGLALYTIWEGIAVFRSVDTYSTSPAFAPIAHVLPYWTVGGVPLSIGLLWLVGIWRKALITRFIVCGSGLFFWLFLTVMFYGNVPRSIIFINTLAQAILQVFMLWHLWAEWLLQQKASTSGQR